MTYRFYCSCSGCDGKFDQESYATPIRYGAVDNFFYKDKVDYLFFKQ